jgi:hypothetical protein
MKILQGEIYVRYTGTQKYPFDWTLTKGIVVELSNGVVTEIPAGFETDFTSVPRRLWSIISPIGQYNLAAIIHDYLYTHHIYSRAFADGEFLNWMNHLTMEHRFRNRIMYICLRLFGKARFMKYASN